jgi:hypothetical protein
MIAHAGLPLVECADAAADVPSFPASVNLLPPKRNREAVNDDELIAAMVGGHDTGLGDDTGLQELFTRHALTGGHEPVHRPDAAAVR